METLRTASVYGVLEGNVVNFFLINNSDKNIPENAIKIVETIIQVDNNNTGWSYLTVHTSHYLNDIIQAYWAGYTEGLVSHDLTIAHHINYVQPTCKFPYSKFCLELESYVNRNWQWMKQQVVNFRHDDPFWHQIELQMWQLKGLDDAFNNVPFPTTSEGLTLEIFLDIQIDIFGIYYIQLEGDIEDLKDALNSSIERVVGDGSCSAFIKLLPNNADLYVGHNTWYSYSTMLRVLKYYDFHFAFTAKENSPLIPSNKMSFSSYPSKASSGDDFYLMQSGLVTVETTNMNFNEGLLSLIQNGAENSVFEVFRAQVANRLATKGSEWINYFSMYNSGTYNNQWMVVDYNLFTPGFDIPDAGVLYVAEQMPGNVEAHDMTITLKSKTYWASYNVPAFQNTFDTLGHNKMMNRYGNWFNHEESPRANMFRRDQNKVVDEKSLIKLLRYNDFQHDPFSRCNCTPPYSAENAIAARSDLNLPNGIYPYKVLARRSHGATDVKIVNYKLLPTMNFIAECGPTHDDQPVFQWSKSGFNDSHVMHPDRFDFQPILTQF